MQHRLQHRHQVLLANRFYATHYLPSRHRVHRVDMIQPGSTILVSTLLCPSADIQAGPAIVACGACRCSPYWLAYVPLARAPGDTLSAASGAIGAIHTDPRQSLLLLVREDLILASQNSLDCRPGDCRPGQFLVQSIYPCQQLGIFVRVASREAAPPSAWARSSSLSSTGLISRKMICARLRPVTFARNGRTMPHCSWPSSA